MIQDVFLLKLTCEAFAGIHFQNQRVVNYCSVPGLYRVLLLLPPWVLR